MKPVPPWEWELREKMEREQREKELARLRAELAALREKLKSVEADWGYECGRADAAETREEEARALLARVREETVKDIIGIVFRACQGFKDGGQIFGIIDDDTRAFLAGGEEKP